MDPAAKAAALIDGPVRWRGTRFTWPRLKGSAMKIPEGIRIPLIVFTLQAALLTGAGLIFLVLRPHW